VAALNEWGWCSDPACTPNHVRSVLPPPPHLKRGKKTDVECPGCGTWNADFNAAGVSKVHLVGSCHPLTGTACSPADMRQALINKFHVDPVHLGLFGMPAKGSQAAGSSARSGRATPGERTAARKWFAARKLPGGLSLYLRLMCEQAIDEWDGDWPPGDPRELLGLDFDVFNELTKRTGGIDPTYRRKLWRQWASHPIWEQSDAC
jgi:hypothetical protein